MIFCTDASLTLPIDVNLSAVAQLSEQSKCFSFWKKNKNQTATEK